jgi:nucleotide-binding universal stress UspA family protein
MAGRVVIGYDGSDDARRAVEVAAGVLGRVREAGLAAEADVRRGDSAGDIGAALLDAAEQHDADLVVVGRRGISRIQAVVLGSVSDAAVRDGRRPVLVVPATD